MTNSEIQQRMESETVKEIKAEILKALETESDIDRLRVVRVFLTS